MREKIKHSKSKNKKLQKQLEKDKEKVCYHLINASPHTLIMTKHWLCRGKRTQNFLLHHQVTFKMIYNTNLLPKVVVAAVVAAVVVFVLTS